MTDPREPERDAAADTERFRAFANRQEPPVERPSSTFRVLTLLAGIAVFAAIVWLLLR